MVAYSFQTRFVPFISDGLKRQTIRLDRKRHVRSGELIQLYCGMRTKNCFKIVPDVVCRSIHPIQIEYKDGGFEVITLDGAEIPKEDWDAFAKADGFAEIGEMQEFWVEKHNATEPDKFEGVLIRWEDAPK